jgi:hypothetical protein
MILAEREISAKTNWWITATLLARGSSESLQKTHSIMRNNSLPDLHVPAILPAAAASASHS